EWTPTWREAGTCPCPPTETRRDADSSGGTHYDFRPRADGAAGASVRGEAGWSKRCAGTERGVANGTEKARNGGGYGAPPPRRDTFPSRARVARTHANAHQGRSGSPWLCGRARVRSSVLSLGEHRPDAGPPTRGSLAPSGLPRHRQPIIISGVSDQNLGTDQR